MKKDLVNLETDEPLKYEGPLAEDKEYTIKIICDHSIKKEEIFFLNKFKNKGFGYNKHQLENFFLSKLYEIENKKFKESKLPFCQDNCLYIDDINTYERLAEIIGEYDTNTPSSAEEFEGSYFKGYFCLYGDSKKEKENLFRIVYYFDEINHVIVVVLIDPYHMLATHLFEEQYKENCGNQVDLEDLKKEYSSLYA